MGQVLADVVVNTVDLAFANSLNTGPLIKAGKLRAIAVTHPTRKSQLPDVPTIAEQAVEVIASTREATTEFIRSEMKRYAEVVKFSGAKVD